MRIKPEDVRGPFYILPVDGPQGPALALCMADGTCLPGQVGLEYIGSIDDRAKVTVTFHVFKGGLIRAELP